MAEARNEEVRESLRNAVKDESGARAAAISEKAVLSRERLAELKK